MLHTQPHDDTDVIHKAETAPHDVPEGLSEAEKLSHNAHRRLERPLLLRNIAAPVAVVLFVTSLFSAAYTSLIKAIAYFPGCIACCPEIVLLTDCFTRRVPHREMFMAYCFGPMYLLLGLSYLLRH